MRDIGSKLSELRNNRGWNKTQAAAHLGIPTSTYSNYEYGNREPDLGTINKIADFYDVSADYLLGRNSDSDASRFDLGNDMPLSYHGYNIPDKYLDMVKGLMEADIKDGKADKDEQPK